jgi:hypothetical protein
MQLRKQSACIAMNSHPELSGASAGVADPVGCRVALSDYGEVTGWPLMTLGPLTLRKGKENWTRSLAAAQPLWLGVAWEAIERMEHEKELDREAEIQEQSDKDKEMTVLAWVDSKGIEPGDYPAMITSIEEVSGEYGDQLQLQLVVLDADGEQTNDEIRAWCSAKWTDRSKLFEWTKAILGKRAPTAGQPMDTDRLKNKKVDIRVEEKLGKSGQMRSSVTAMFPFNTISAKRDDPDESDPPF